MVFFFIFPNYCSFNTVLGIEGGLITLSLLEGIAMCKRLAIPFIFYSFFIFLSRIFFKRMAHACYLTSPNPYAVILLILINSALRIFAVAIINSYLSFGTY